MLNTSFIEISERALRNNLAFIRNRLSPNTAFSSVIKGNAYGHGIEEFVPLAQRCGVTHFSVFSAEEAYRAWAASQGQSDIMIMGMIDREDLIWAIENEISYFVFDLERLEQSLEVSKFVKKPAKIHLELETGMNRTGLDRKIFRQVLAMLQQNPGCFSIEGFCTHYAGAESIANYLRVQKQVKNFHAHSKWFSERGIVPRRKHTACSAAAMSHPKTHMDMVRIGIMQYGYWPSRETLIGFLSKQPEKEDPLKRVITWKSKVMTTKHIKQGEFIGYGTTYLAESDMRTAIVPVGYSGGYSRSLSNQGRVLINGVRVSVIGIVNMNMLIVDVTNAPETWPGDEVILIGNQEGLDISVASFGELSNQLNYELLTRLPHDIPRNVTN